MSGSFVVQISVANTGAARNVDPTSGDVIETSVSAFIALEYPNTATTMKQVEGQLFGEAFSN